MDPADRIFYKDALASYPLYESNWIMWSNDVLIGAAAMGLDSILLEQEEEATVENEFETIKAAVF